MASPNLVIGTYVSFQSKSAPEYYFKGTVYFVEPENGRFGIEEVSRQEMGGTGNSECLEEEYQFFLKDIKNLEVIALPSPQPESTTSTTKDDRKRKSRNDASSSASPPPSA